MPVISNLLELVFLNNGSAKLIKYLIFKIKKYFLPETFGESFLHLAAYHGNIEIFEMLLQIGLNPKKTSEKINSKLKMQNLHHSLTPMTIAIMRGNTEIIKRLITIHNSEDIQRLILTAIEHDHTEIVKVLYQFEKLPRKNVSFETIGSLLNSDTFCERWCYHAAILGKVDTLQMLISLGDLPKNSEAIQKLILRTIEFDQPEIVKMLYPLEKLPTSLYNLSTMECFLYCDRWSQHASTLGKVNTLKMLISLGDLPLSNKGEGEHIWLLHRVARKGYSEILKILIGFCNDPNAIDRSGQTLLHTGAQILTFLNILSKILRLKLAEILLVLKGLLRFGYLYSNNIQKSGMH